MNWLRSWWRSHYVVATRYERVPTPGSFQLGVINTDVPEKAAHFFLLRLPSFGYGYDISSDRLRWGQRVLMYHGRKGLSVKWLFAPQSETAATSAQRCTCIDCRIDNERV